MAARTCRLGDLPCSPVLWQPAPASLGDLHHTSVSPPAWQPAPAARLSMPMYRSCLTQTYPDSAAHFPVQDSCSCISMLSSRADLCFSSGRAESLLSSHLLQSHTLPSSVSPALSATSPLPTSRLPQLPLLVPHQPLCSQWDNSERLHWMGLCESE